MQELNQIKLKDAAGKTIAEVSYTDDYLYLKYTDGSFSFLNNYENYDTIYQNDYLIKYSDILSSVNVRNDGSLYYDSAVNVMIKFGIINEQQLIEDSKEKIEKHLDWIKKQELKRYEELKVKFEGGKDSGNTSVQ